MTARGRDREPTAAEDLCAFVDASPSPHHAVAEMARRLEAAGSRALDERDPWKLTAGELVHVVRDGGSVVALRVGTAEPSAGGFRILGAHTDSPALKVRPRPDVRRSGYRLVGVEPYGGALLYTWLDRDLTLAGRIAVRDGADVGIRLVRLPGAPLRIPSLAIHLQRELRESGLKLDPQRHLVPVWGPDLDGEPGLVEALAAAAGVDPADVLGHDLVTADTAPAALGGAGETYVFAPRLDNLYSCHAGLVALQAAPPTAATQVLVANDHEEVGSGTYEGAAGSLLSDVVERVVEATEPEGSGQALRVALARSWAVSSDAAHAVHPNHAERHEPGHLPRLGGGPVLKVNANQAYATDATSGARFAARCADAGVPLQHFVSRADLPCGSTIGPLTATRLGVATVDVGPPVLSMHSIREQAAVVDVALMAEALAACLS